MVSCVPSDCEPNKASPSTLQFDKVLFTKKKKNVRKVTNTLETQIRLVIVLGVSYTLERLPSCPPPSSASCPFSVCPG